MHTKNLRLQELHDDTLATVAGGAPDGYVAVGTTGYAAPGPGLMVRSFWEQRGELPTLVYPDGHIDAVAALGTHTIMPFNHDVLRDEPTASAPVAGAPHDFDPPVAYEQTAFTVPDDGAPLALAPSFTDVADDVSSWSSEVQLDARYQVAAWDGSMADRLDTQHS